MPYGFERVLGRLAEIGYKEVEFAGYTQNSAILGRQITPEEIRKILDDNGLRANGSHASIPGTVNPTTIAQFEQQLDIAETLGMTHIGTGNDPTGSNYKADWDAAVDRWNTFGEMAAARGLKLYTHNHDAAYNFLLDSGPLDAQGRPTRSSGVRKLEYFIGLTNPEWVWFEMDIYWAHVAQHRFRSYTDPDGVTQTEHLRPAGRGRGPADPVPAVPRQGRHVQPGQRGRVRDGAARRGRHRLRELLRQHGREGLPQPDVGAGQRTGRRRRPGPLAAVRGDQLVQQHGGARARR